MPKLTTSRNLKGIAALAIAGILLLSIGLIASFYEQVEWIPGAYDRVYRISGGYPYQTVGMVLVIAGILFL